MKENVKIIQEKLMASLERLDNAVADVDLNAEVYRSNAISQLANAYIKSCNLVIKVEESKKSVRNKIGEVINNEE